MKHLKILALSFLLFACAQAQTLEEAIRKTGNEQYDAAEADFRQLIAKQPTDSRLYFYYGENFFRYNKTDLELAHEQWQKGISIDPASQLNTVGLGKYHWYKGDTIAGRQYFNKALAASRNKNAEVMRQIAKVLLDAPKKDLNGAVTLMSAAIKKDPKNSDNHLILGDACRLLDPENSSKAAKSYNDALALDPKSAKAIVRTAMLYWLAKNYQLASDRFKAAQAADPTYAPAYRLNGGLDLQFKHPERAIENYKKYLELINSAEARFYYGAALIQGNRVCEAVPELESAASQGFSDQYAKQLLANAIQKCNEKNAGKEESSGTRYSVPVISDVETDPTNIPEHIIVEKPIDGPLTIVDEYASFPGGVKALNAFLAEHIRNPSNMNGKCFVRFVVGTDGTITEVKVTRGVADCPECDKEAVRAVKLMPPWTPAKERGKVVSCYFNLPIVFRSE